jgi:tol-pal system protein YbgF
VVEEPPRAVRDYRELTLRTPLPILLLAALAATAADVAPVSAQNREHQQMAAELRMLQEQNQQLALTLAQLADAIKAVNGSIAESNQENVRRFAAIENTLRSVAGDMNAMRTRTDETNTLIRTLSEDIEALRKTLVDLPGRLSEQLTRLTFTPPPVDPNDPTAPSVAAGPPPPVDLAPILNVGQTPTQMYEMAYGDYAGGQFATAITGFEQFLKAFGKTSMRAGAAQFFIGDSYYAQNRFEEAIRAYDAVIRDYPKDEYVPQALWKRGNAQQRLGQTDAARASFELVIKNYPNDSYASLAKQRLGGLTTPPPATRKP